MLRTPFHKMKGKTDYLKALINFQLKVERLLVTLETVEVEKVLLERGSRSILLFVVVRLSRFELAASEGTPDMLLPVV